MTGWTGLRIIAGRGTARAAIQLSGVALLPVWGVDTFGGYAAATGGFTWLLVLVMGAEKAALTVLPRTRVLSAQYTRMLLGRAATPLAVTLVITAGLLAAGSSTVVGAAAAWAAGQGLLSALAATHRLGGKPSRDSAGYAALAGWVVAMSALAAVTGLKPLGYLITLLAGVIVDCAVLAAMIPALRHRPARIRPRLGGVINRRALLLGLSEVADSASAAVLYLTLSVLGRPAGSTLLFVALLVSSSLGSLGTLVLRIRQPVTSLRLRGTGGHGGRRTARRITGWTAVISWTSLAGIAAAVPALHTGGANPAALAACVAVEMTVFCAVVYAVYLVENTNGAVLSITLGAALAGLAGTTVVAVLVIPALSAVGAVLALIAGLATKSTVLHVRLRHRERPSPAAVPVLERAG